MRGQPSFLYLVASMHRNPPVIDREIHDHLYTDQRDQVSRLSVRKDRLGAQYALPIVYKYEWRLALVPVNPDLAVSGWASTAPGVQVL